MKLNTLEITVVDNELNENGAVIKLEGNQRKITEAICRFIQTNMQFRMIVFEALINSIHTNPPDVREEAKP